MKIYDYAGKATVIQLPQKEIKLIDVAVITGDEVGYVEFVDGEKIEFDASNTRNDMFFDGCYIVEGERIKEWIEFKPTTSTPAYERRDRFKFEEEN